MKSKSLKLAMLMMVLLFVPTLSQASIYNFDVTVDYTGLTAVQKIQGIEFTIVGTGWSFSGFSTPYNGTWFFSSTGIIDDTYTSPNINTSVPLNSGTIFSLTTSNSISITNIVAFDYQNHDFTGPFTAHLNAAPVPIPAAMWLLGSGLVGLVGLRRRMRK
jgi:hypothetical protein